MRPLRPIVRRHRVLVPALVLAAGVVATGCGSDTESGLPPAPATSGAEDEEAPEDDREPQEVVVEAVDATLDVESLRIRSQASLRAGSEAFGLFSEGSVDYGAVVADLTLGVEQQGAETEVTVLSDGEDAWVSVTGDNAPEFPGGAAWVSGDADLLADSSTLDPSGLLGAIVALRAAEDVSEFDTESHDGVETRVYSTTVTYADALEAAGEDRAAFQSALSLTGAAQQSDLEIQVAIGPDDVIRTYDLDIESEADVSGGYDIDLSGVDRPVGAPAAPNPDDVAEGPAATRQFEELLST